MIGLLRSNLKIFSIAKVRCFMGLYWSTKGCNLAAHSYIHASFILRRGLTRFQLHKGFLGLRIIECRNSSDIPLHNHGLRKVYIESQISLDAERFKEIENRFFFVLFCILILLILYYSAYSFCIFLIFSSCSYSWSFYIDFFYWSWNEEFNKLIQANHFKKPSQIKTYVRT